MALWWTPVTTGNVTLCACGLGQNLDKAVSEMSVIKNNNNEDTPYWNVKYVPHSGVVNMTQTIKTMCTSTLNEEQCVKVPVV